MANAVRANERHPHFDQGAYAPETGTFEIDGHVLFPAVMLSSLQPQSWVRQSPTARPLTPRPTPI
ncbi:MAG: hypothetical protein ACXVEF_18635 [Polyangiales bacterium]